MNEKTLQKILNFANFSLARAAQSTANLRAKLTKKFPENATEIEKVCAELKRVGILNDAKFAANFVRNRAGRGERQIIFELQRKGIDENLAREVLRAENFSETAEIENAAARKLSSLRNCAPEKRREKLSRFLAGRGFSFDEIHNFCREINFDKI